MLLHVSILRLSSGSAHCSLLKLYVKMLITVLYLSVMRQHIVCVCICCIPCREVGRLAPVGLLPCKGYNIYTYFWNTWRKKRPEAQSCVFKNYCATVNTSNGQVNSVSFWSSRQDDFTRATENEADKSTGNRNWVVASTALLILWHTVGSDEKAV